MGWLGGCKDRGLSILTPIHWPVLSFRFVSQRIQYRHQRSGSGQSTCCLSLRTGVWISKACKSLGAWWSDQCHLLSCLIPSVPFCVLQGDIPISLILVHLDQSFSRAHKILLYCSLLLFPLFCSDILPLWSLPSILYSSSSKSFSSPESICTYCCPVCLYCCVYKTTFHFFGLHLFYWLSSFCSPLWISATWGYGCEWYKFGDTYCSLICCGN